MLWLLSDSELFNKLSIRIDVFAGQISEQPSSLTYKCKKGLSARVIFLVLAKVI